MNECRALSIICADTASCVIITHVMQSAANVMWCHRRVVEVRAESLLHVALRPVVTAGIGAGGVHVGPVVTFHIVMVIVAVTGSLASDRTERR